MYLLCDFSDVRAVDSDVLWSLRGLSTWADGGGTFAQEVSASWSAFELKIIVAIGQLHTMGSRETEGPMVGALGGRRYCS